MFCHDDVLFWRSWVVALVVVRSVSGILAAALLGGLGLGCLALTAAADTNLLAPDKRLHVVTDPRNGLAIFGYDPVAFHDQQKAISGVRAHEVELDGRIWRFHKAANKVAFEADPSIYLPRFGGHDATAASEGLLIKGDPEFFVIAGGETVFFLNSENRDRYAGDPEIRRKALANWPGVVRLHAGH